MWILRMSENATILCPQSVLIVRNKNKHRAIEGKRSTPTAPDCKKRGEWGYHSFGSSSDLRVICILWSLASLSENTTTTNLRAKNREAVTWLQPHRSWFLFLCRTSDWLPPIWSQSPGFLELQDEIDSSKALFSISSKICVCFDPTVRKKRQHPACGVHHLQLDSVI